MADGFLKIGGVDENGLSRGFKTTETGAQKVHPIGEIGVYITSFGSLEAGEERVCLETTDPTELNFLEFSTSHDAGQVSIYHRQENGLYMSIGQLNLSGSQPSGFTATAINAFGSHIWSISSFEEGKYKFNLKNIPWKFPNGVKITVKNNRTADSITAGVRGYGVSYNV